MCYGLTLFFQCLGKLLNLLMVLSESLVDLLYIVLQESSLQHWRSKINNWESAIHDSSTFLFFIYFFETYHFFSCKWCQRVLEPNRNLEITQTTTLLYSICIDSFVQRHWASSILCTSQYTRLHSTHLGTFQIKNFHSPLEGSRSNSSNQF